MNFDPSNEPSYSDQLAREAEAWNRSAEGQAATVQPDWAHHRTLLLNAVAHAADIDGLLDNIQRGMSTLELGCGSGWLTLAMAEKGATVLGMDIAERAIALARSHYASIRSSIPGTVAYRVADLNRIDLPVEQYDLVVAYGILHHLVEAPRLVAEVYKSLRPGGLFWISDIASHETAETVLLAGLLAFLLPTHVPYREKIAGLLKFGFRIPARVRASMQSEGASPFEGVGRETEWPEAVRRRFTVERLEAHPAVTGYIASQVNLPDRVALPILHALQAVDSAFVRWGLLRSTGLTVYARKPRSAGATR